MRVFQEFMKILKISTLPLSNSLSDSDSVCVRSWRKKKYLLILIKKSETCVRSSQNLIIYTFYNRLLDLRIVYYFDSAINLLKF